MAITRAEKELMITYTRQRYRWGQLYDCTPSRFIKDIDPKYINFLSPYLRKETSFSDELNYYESITNSGLFENNSNFGQTKLKKLTFTGERKGQLPENFKNADTSKEEGYAGNVKVKAGDAVKHSRFGIGKVISVEGNFPNTKAVILFQTAGRKNLLLKFAKLKVINERALQIEFS